MIVLRREVLLVFARDYHGPDVGLSLRRLQSGRRLVIDVRDGLVVKTFKGTVVACSDSADDDVPREVEHRGDRWDGVLEDGVIGGNAGFGPGGNFLATATNSHGLDGGVG
ncbi:hypothetical protein N7492_004572 [Penicillium capsulatum]|uniref:Uncharacterized protein n=1 Tax=Penicillium capsulatum TaxID=69766 RepID=A0A9W9IA51_9EURO|nr:hypothetical protein N7492_004572 [Penicillium capsulatum]